MNRSDAVKKLGEFDDAFDTVEALIMLSVTAEGECGLYMNDAATTIEGLHELLTEIIQTGIAPQQEVTA
jgi:hypothetical protein